MVSLNNKLFNKGTPTPELGLYNATPLANIPRIPNPEVCGFPTFVPPL